MADKPERIDTYRVDLSDGRTAHVLEYADGSVRFKLSNPPYVLVECYMQGQGEQAIIKLLPAHDSQAVVPESSKRGWKWTKSEFADRRSALAFTRQAISEGQRVEGPNPPKQEADSWVVWTTEVSD
jgi:hypothetical protein